MLNNIFFHQKGQVVIIFLLVVVVALAVGLSTVGRSVTEIATSSRTEDSSRAFSAAEAGLEKALRAQDSVSPASLENQAKYEVDTKKNLPDPDKAMEHESVSKNSIVQFWLAAPFTVAATPTVAVTPTAVPTPIPTAQPSNGCNGISYTLVPPAPEAPNASVAVNINRLGANSCYGNWDNIGFKLDGVSQPLSLCYDDHATNCASGYHSHINSGASATHNIQLTVNNNSCYCNSTTFQTSPTAAPTPTINPTAVTPYYRQGSFDLYFGTAPDSSYTTDPSSQPAVEVNVVSYDGTKYVSNRYFYDSSTTDPGPAGRGGFNGCPNRNSSGFEIDTDSIGHKNKFYCYVNITGYPYSGVSYPVIVRVKLLYGGGINHPIALKPVVPGGTCPTTNGCSLPPQKRTYTSTGNAGNSQRRLEVDQFQYVIPQIFDYAVFTMGEFNK